MYEHILLKQSKWLVLLALLQVLQHTNSLQCWESLHIHLAAAGNISLASVTLGFPDNRYFPFSTGILWHSPQVSHNINNKKLRPSVGLFLWLCILPKRGSSVHKDFVVHFVEARQGTGNQKEMWKSWKWLFQAEYELKACMRGRFSRKNIFLNCEVSEYKYRGKYEYKRSSLRCKHKYFSTRILLYWNGSNQHTHFYILANSISLS